MRKPSLFIWTGACVALLASACAEPPPLHDDVPRGGWDGNSGNFNGNLGSFATVSGLPGLPDWAPDPTGAGTVNNATIYGLRYTPTQGSAPCARASSGITAVRFLSSTGTGAAGVGPDLEVERAAGSARLGLGETIVFPGAIVDGYQHTIDVMLEVQRVDTLVYRNVPDLAWPVFALRVCENLHAADLDHPAWKHLGFVSWAPFVRLPELAGESLAFRTDLVQAVTTLPRAEYRNNPNVPAVVAAQTGALVFKFAFFSGVPVALHGEAALDLRSAVGAIVNNAEFIFRGGLALGDASWVTFSSTEDPAQHRFLSLFTRDGTEVALFGLARGDGVNAAAIHAPPSWGGGVLAPLELTDDERTAEAADCLDNVQASTSSALAPGQRLAASPTHAASGLSTYRAGLYLNSPNNRKYAFYAQLRASVEASRLGAIGGRVSSQVALENELRAPTGALAFVVAAQSPLPPGTQPFEQPTNVDPPPPGAPVIPPGPPTDGGGDAGFDAGPTDGGADAGVDAGPPDGGADAGADAGVDAGPPDGPPDGPIADAPGPPDSGFDAGADALVDAPGEGGMDSGLGDDGPAP